MHSENGTVRLDVPRDRSGSFEPAIVPKHTTRLAGLEQRMGMYAGGMTVRDIRDQLAEIYGVDVSRDVITKVTDAVWGRGARVAVAPLGPRVPGGVPRRAGVQVRDEGVVRNKGAHIALGVTMDSRREVLGIWLETTEARSSGCGS